MNWSLISYIFFILVVVDLKAGVNLLTFKPCPNGRAPMTCMLGMNV